MTQPTVARIRQLRVEQGPGVVADGAQAGNAAVSYTHLTLPTSDLV